MEQQNGMMQQRQPERIVSGQAYDEDARIDVSVRRNGWRSTSAKNASREYPDCYRCGTEPR